MKNEGKGAVIVFLEQIVNAITSFIISIVLARTLVTEDFGLWKLLASITVLVTYFTSFGLEISITRYIPSFLVSREKKNIQKIVFNSLMVRVALLLLTFIIVYKYEFFINQSFKTAELFSDYLIVTFGYLFVYHLNTIIGRSVLTGFGKRYIVGIVKIISRLFTLAGIVYVTTNNYDFEAILYVLFFSQVIEMVLYLPFFINHVFSKHKETDINAKFPLKRVIRFALPNYFYLSGQVFREYTIDNFVISWYMNLQSVAYYGVAIAFPTYFRNFSPGRMLQGVLLPTLVRKYTQDKSDQLLKDFFVFIQKINAFLLWPFYCFFIVFAREIILFIYGDAYEDSVLSAQLLLLFSMIQTSADSFYPICHTIERSNLILQTMIWGIINLVGNVLLVPRFGIEGAAVATGLVSIGTYIHFYISLKREGLNFVFPSESKIILLNLLPAIVIFGVIKYFELFDLTGLLLMLLSVLSFLVMSSRFKIFNQSERKILKDQFHITFDVPFI